MIDGKGVKTMEKLASLIDQLKETVTLLEIENRSHEVSPLVLDMLARQRLAPIADQLKDLAYDLKVKS